MTVASELNKQCCSLRVHELHCASATTQSHAYNVGLRRLIGALDRTAGTFEYKCTFIPVNVTGVADMRIGADHSCSCTKMYQLLLY